MRNYLFGVCLILLSCEKRGYESYRVDTVYELIGESLSGLDSVLISFPSQLEIKGNCLYIRDDNDVSGALFRFSFPELELQHQFGTIGHAATEYLYPDRFQIRDDKCYLWDFDSQKYIIYNFNEIEKPEVIQVDPLSRAMWEATMISDSLIVFSDGYSPRLLSIQNSVGELMDSVIFLPKAEKEVVISGVSSNGIYGMTLYFDDTSRLLVGGSYSGDVVCFYKPCSGDVHFLVGEEGLPDMNKLNNGWVSTGTKPGYEEMRIVGEKVYGLRWERKGDSQAKQNTDEQMRRIHVFCAHTYKFLYAYQLDRDIITFDVDEKTNTLYAVASEDNSFVRYKL